MVETAFKGYGYYPTQEEHYADVMRLREEYPDWCAQNKDKVMGFIFSSSPGYLPKDFQNTLRLKHWRESPHKGKF